MIINRVFTSSEIAPYKTCKWEKRPVSIRDINNTIIFHKEAAEFPTQWSQLASDIVAAKYFRKIGNSGKKVESSLKQLLQRITNTITKAALKNKILNRKNAKIFQDELTFLLLHQYGSFNSPVWFNLGLKNEYGNTSEHYNFYFDKNGKIKKSQDALTYPQTSACFIQSISDSIDSIYELAANEARIFKFGSGTGTNFSPLRAISEPLAGGGTSSGLLSFLDFLDRSAGAIKSGGTTRRAAKMVLLDADHPEILPFIEWKAKEEKKAQALIRAGYSSDFEGDAYRTISGQNANLSIRLSDDFFSCLDKKALWATKCRSLNKIHRKIPAENIWNALGKAAWECADPGVQFSTTINSWHTCPASGAIEASNPCSEFLFLNDTACNLASLNLKKFIDPVSGDFLINEFSAACKIFIIAQEVLVGISGYPTEKIAANTFAHRPLGLGYSNLGALLISQGIPYDSENARTLAASITALMQGEALSTSAILAKNLKPFAAFKKNRTAMLRVVQRHLNAAKKINPNTHDNLKNAAILALENALALGKKYGFRNAQTTVLAPTGTISLMMDCDTTGIEPEFSLVKFKKLAGGGDLKIVNQSVQEGLQKLGYSQSAQKTMLEYIIRVGELAGCSEIKKEDLPVFSCAHNTSSQAISADGHILMLASVQPFLSGAISKTVNLAHDAKVDDILNIYRKAWELGLKSISVYRDGAKLSQPLSKKELIICSVCGNEAAKVGGCIQCSHCGHNTSCG